MWNNCHFYIKHQPKNLELKHCLKQILKNFYLLWVHTMHMQLWLQKGLVHM